MVPACPVRNFARLISSALACCTEMSVFFGAGGGGGGGGGGAGAGELPPKPGKLKNLFTRVLLLIDLSRVAHLNNCNGVIAQLCMPSTDLTWPTQLFNTTGPQFAFGSYVTLIALSPCSL